MERPPHPFRGVNGFLQRLPISPKNGTVIEETWEYPKGHPMNPADRSAVDAKFRKLAVPALGEMGTKALVSKLRSLASQPNLSEVTAGMRAIPIR